MAEDTRKTISETLKCLDAAIGSPRIIKEYNTSNDFNRTTDMTLLEDVTVPIPFSCTTQQVNLDETSAVLLAHDDPGVKALQVLFSEFINIYVSHSSSDSQIWDEISAYEEVCAKQVEMLQKIIRKVPRHHANFAKTQEMALKMVGERNTWRLLRSLFMERQSDHFDDDDRPVIDTMKHRTDKDIISQLYEGSALMREAQNVVDWLEKNAKDDGKLFDPVDYFGEAHFAWQNTLRIKKNEKDGQRTGIGSQIAIMSDHSLVTSLDPDATRRQQTNLHDLDEEEDQRLLRCMFACVRAGQIIEAQDLCAKAGQHWRAATLEGWKLSHDSNKLDQVQRNPVQGNRYRDVWKSVAWKIASDKRLIAEERAMYGAFCAHLPAMLLVCSNWEDQLWAYFRTLIDQRVEETLRESSLHLRPLHPLPNEYPEEKFSLEVIFKSIENRIGPHKLTFYHHLQKYLILNDIDGLVRMSHDALNQTELSSHHLRCLTHLILILKRLGALSYDLENQATDIFHACVKEAIERGDIEQVARYCAFLPACLQTRSYADFLVNISEEHHRKHALNMASMMALDTQAITATVVAKIRLLPIADDSNELISDNTAEDKSKMNAIDWLMYDRVQRPEALRQANAMFRQFLISRKITAAKALFNKIPGDSVDVIFKLQKAKCGSSELPLYYENRIKEYLCFKSFLDAQEAFTDWFDHYHQKKPNTPKKPTSNPTFHEQLSFDHKTQQYNAEYDKWKQTLDHITRKCCERLYNVLMFPDGGWLVDMQPPPLEDAEMFDSETSYMDSGSEQEDALDLAPEDKRIMEYLGPEIASREPNRSHQLNTLRSIFIPQVTSLLQNVLHCTKSYKECVQLSDLIASEQYALYKCFNSAEMQRFLYKMQDTCRELLDKIYDALGYPQR